MLGDEDNCLTLNVYVPDNLPPKAPVLVWIHGGGLMTGAAPLYNLSALAAAGGAVGVTVQYRLNALGFLAAPGLASVGAGGNLGVADQLAALKWVNTHAAARRRRHPRHRARPVGGRHLGAPPRGGAAARGLFARAVAQSPWWAGRLIAGIDTATAARKVWSGCVGDANATAAGGDAPAPLCAKESGDELLSCLQAAPIADVLGACGDVVAVTTDGGVLDAATPTPMESMCANADGVVANAPFPGLGDGALLVGSTVDEYRYWAMGYASSAEAAAALESSTREHIGTYLALDLDLVAGAQVTPNATWGPSRRRAPPIMCSARRPRRTPPTSRCRYPSADVDADAKQAAAEMMVGDSAAAPSILSAEQAAALVTDAWFHGARRPRRRQRRRRAVAVRPRRSGGDRRQHDGGPRDDPLRRPAVRPRVRRLRLAVQHLRLCGGARLLPRADAGDGAHARRGAARVGLLRCRRQAGARRLASHHRLARRAPRPPPRRRRGRGEHRHGEHSGGRRGAARRLHCDRDAVRAEVIDHCAHPPGDDHHLLLAASDADRRRGRRADDHSLSPSARSPPHGLVRRACSCSIRRSPLTLFLLGQFLPLLLL